MPLWKEDRDRMRGVHADLRNTSDRWGSANTAAAFLAHFVDVRHWAHLDIAGPAYRVAKTPRGEAGATGFAICTALEVIEGFVDR
jgi:leucyl aminopeptidase